MNHMFGRSGKYLMLMTYGWIAPFALLHLGRYPLRQYQTSYYPFLVAFVTTAVVSLAGGILERRYNFWEPGGFWQKYFLLMGMYCLNIGVILVITLIMSSYGWISYFGGDAEGSFGMLYIPSAFFYLTAGMIFGFSRRIGR